MFPLTKPTEELKLNRNEQNMIAQPFNSNANAQTTDGTAPPSMPNRNSNAAVERRFSLGGSRLRLSPSTGSASAVIKLGASAAPSALMAVLHGDPLDAPVPGITGVAVPCLPLAQGSGSGGSSNIAPALRQEKCAAARALMDRYVPLNTKCVRSDLLTEMGPSTFGISVCNSVQKSQDWKYRRVENNSGHG